MGVSKPFSFPKTNPSCWPMKINKEWLSTRGLSTSGNAYELRERVAKHMLQDDPLLVSKISNITIHHIIRMMISVYNSVSLLRSRVIDENHRNRTHGSIIRALNDIHMVDKHLRATEKYPIWVVKYNLLCLLNASKDMETFGPPVNRWEGGEEGEKGIQLIKKHFNGFKTGYQLQIHEKCNLEMTIKNLNISSGKNHVTNQPSVTNLEKNKQFIHYKNILFFSSRLLRGYPLSLVLVNSNLAGKIFDEDLVGFVINGDEFISLQNLKYETFENYCSVFSIGRISSMDSVARYNLDDLHVIDYLMAIPYVLKNKKLDNKCLYYIISKSGKELTSQKKLEFSHW